MDDATLQKLLQARRTIAPSGSSDPSLTDRIMAQLPPAGTLPAVINPLPLLGVFAAMVAIAVAIGMLVAPTHQHDHHHADQPPLPPAMDGFDSSALLVTR